MLYLSGVKRPGRALLWTPRTRYALDDVPVFAVDNGCYTNSYPGDERFLAALDRISAHRERCLWVAVPDVVADAQATLEAWSRMAEPIAARGWPTALVLQDGMSSDDIERLQPRPSALFIGGSDAYKLGEQVRRIVAHWPGTVHMGRVNSLRRMQYAHRIGVDTVDGTVLAFDPNRRIHEWADELAAQTRLTC